MSPSGRGPGLSVFFHPRSIAVIGATPSRGKVGNLLLRNVLFGNAAWMEREQGFPGRVFPVHPRHPSIYGVRAFPRIQDVPGPVDLAVVVIPAPDVARAVEACGRKGVRGVIVISAGFSETGPEGKRREEELVRIVRRRGMRLIGPNCLGVMSLSDRLNATFARVMPERGPIAFVSQSGALGTGVIEYSVSERFGFSRFVSIGNKADVDDADLLQAFVRDRETRCISFYIESVRDGRRFYETLRRVVPRKPVVVLKAGRTTAGARAAGSHTGALAGSDAAYEAAIHQAGAYRTLGLYGLFDASRALAYQPPMAPGRGVAILTNAGGPGVLAADRAFDLGLPLASLDEATLGKIDRVCPPTWSRSNPIDLIGDADEERYRGALRAAVESPRVGAILVIAARQAMTRLLEISEVIVETTRGCGKPVVACFVGIVAQEADRYLAAHGIPTMEVPGRAVQALYALYLRGRVPPARKRA